MCITPEIWLCGPRNSHRHCLGPGTVFPRSPYFSQCKLPGATLGLRSCVDSRRSWVTEDHEGWAWEACCLTRMWSALSPEHGEVFFLKVCVLVHYEWYLLHFWVSASFISRTPSGKSGVDMSTYVHNGVDMSTLVHNGWTCPTLSTRGCASLRCN